MKKDFRFPEKYQKADRRVSISRLGEHFWAHQLFKGEKQIKTRYNQQGDMSISKRFFIWASPKPQAKKQKELTYRLFSGGVKADLVTSSSQ